MFGVERDVTFDHHLAHNSHSLSYCDIFDLSDFDIRRDVTPGRLRASLRVTIKLACSMESRQNARFMVTRSEARNLPRVTSRLISKLDRVHVNYFRNRASKFDRRIKLFESLCAMGWGCI